MSRSPDLRLLAAVLVAAIVLGAAACGGGDGDDDQSKGGPAAGESAGAAGTTTTTAAEGGGTTTTVAPITPTTTAPAVDSDGGGTTTVPGGGTGDGCAETRSWGTGPSEAGPMAAEDVYRVRPGRHDCYDRVVFDVNGVVDGADAVGFHVAYVDGDVQADGSGEPVPTAGDAALAVIVRAPAQGYGTSGHQPGRLLAELGDDLVTTGQVAGWPALREVTFAGSFEGQTTFAVGVDRQVPFRAGSFEADGYTHVYVDIAHPR
jgi:hypothetical protein